MAISCESHLAFLWSFPWPPSCTGTAVLEASSILVKHSNTNTYIRVDMINCTLTYWHRRWDRIIYKQARILIIPHYIHVRRQICRWNNIIFWNKSDLFFFFFFPSKIRFVDGITQPLRNKWRVSDARADVGLTISSCDEYVITWAIFLLDEHETWYHHFSIVSIVHPRNWMQPADEKARSRDKTSL